MEYSSEVRRRFESPARAGSRDEAHGAAASGEAEDRSLNVWVRFRVEFRQDSVRCVRFEAYGCPHFIAAADWLAERLEGRPAADLAEPAALAARDALGVPTEKLGKLLVLEDALAACLRAGTRPERNTE